MKLGIRDLGFGIRASGFGIRDSGFARRASGFARRALGFARGASRFARLASGFAMLVVLARYVGPCFSGAVSAQTAADGAKVYTDNCASCHDQPTGRTPSKDALKDRTADAIHLSLTSGTMSMQGTT